MCSMASKIHISQVVGVKKPRLQWIMQELVGLDYQSLFSPISNSSNSSNNNNNNSSTNKLYTRLKKSINACSHPKETSIRLKPVLKASFGLASRFHHANALGGKNRLKAFRTQRVGWGKTTPNPKNIHICFFRSWGIKRVGNFRASTFAEFQLPILVDRGGMHEPIAMLVAWRVRFALKFFGK